MILGILGVLGVLGAAFHVTMGATVGVALWWPQHARKWAIACVGFWVSYQAIRLAAGVPL